MRAAIRRFYCSSVIIICEAAAYAVNSLTVIY